MRIIFGESYKCSCGKRFASSGGFGCYGARCPDCVKRISEMSEAERKEYEKRKIIPVRYLEPNI